MPHRILGLPFFEKNFFPRNTKQKEFFIYSVGIPPATFAERKMLGIPHSAEDKRLGIPF
jgi:hypothetical protein